MRNIFDAYRPVTIDGFALWVNPVTGNVRPDVRGGAEGDPDPTPPAPKTFTQDDVNSITGRARAEAKQAAIKELSEQLGCTPEEAKTRLDKLAADEESRKDDLQKAQDAAAAAKAAADAAEAKATAADAEVALTNATSAMTTALLLAGLQAADPKADAAAKQQTLDDALRLVDIDPADDAAAITAKVDALKGRMPALFGPAAPITPPAPTPFGGAQKPPAASAAGGQGESDYERGKRLASTMPHLRSA